MSKIFRSTLIFTFLINVIMFFYACSTNNNAENNKYSADSLLYKAEIFYKNNDYNKAIIYFDKIITSDTTNGILYFKRAHCKSEIQNFTGAIQDNLKAVSLKSMVDKAYFNIGLDYMILNNESKALYYFTKAYETNPNNEKAKYEMDFFQKIVYEDSLQLSDYMIEYKLNPKNQKLKKKIDFLNMKLHENYGINDVKNMTPSVIN